MSEFLEDEIIGEDLDYEEYDLDEEQEEALLAENEQQSFLTEHEPLHISVSQNQTQYTQECIIDQSINYDLQEDEAIIEEEEEDDDEYEDSKSRDRFKSERTKVSLNEPKNSRNIPDSLDDVKMTEVVHSNQRNNFNKRGKFQQRGKNRNIQRRMQPHSQHGYQNYNYVNQWEEPCLRNIPRRPMGPMNPMMDMYNLHALPIIAPPFPYGSNVMMRRPVNPYMMNSPQIPPMSLKRTFNEMNKDKNTNIPRKIVKSDCKESSQNQNKAVSTNPNLTVITTVDLPKPIEKKATQIKVIAANKSKPADTTPKLTPEEADYERKLADQKRKREEILAKKEMRRKEAARKAQMNAPSLISNISTNCHENEHQNKIQRKNLIRFQSKSNQQGIKGDLLRNQRMTNNNYSKQLNITTPQETFSLRTLVHKPSFDLPVNTSVPPPNMVQQSPHTYTANPVVHRPLSTLVPPPSLPPISHQSYSVNYSPDQPPPVSEFRSYYSPISSIGSNLAPNVPPPVISHYNTGRSHLNTTHPTPKLTINYPPPPLTQTLPHSSMEYYQEQVSVPTYGNNDYDDQDCLSEPVMSPEKIQSQSALYSQKYKWKNQQNPIVRSIPSGSNITINTSNKVQASPIKRIKKYKRIIRKNKNGDVLLIKKLDLDDDGNPTGVEEVEYIQNVISEDVAMKKFTIDKVLKNVIEPVQHKGNISSKHFRGADGQSLNKMGEVQKKANYSMIQPAKRVVTTLVKDRTVQPVQFDSTTVLLKRIPSNVTVHELKSLVENEGLESAKSILYDKAERKCSFEFNDQEVAEAFCNKMNGRMLKMSIIQAGLV